MKTNKYSKPPLDAKDRMNIEPIVCYPIDNLKETNLPILHRVRKNLKNISEIIIPPRDAKTFEVKKGQFFRIESTDSKGVNWFTIGVSPNIIDASFKALVDSLDYKLLKDKAPASL